MFAAAEGGLGLLGDILGLLMVPALVLLNGLFVAAEFALVSVRKTRVEELLARGVKSARAVLTAIEDLDRSIASTQLGITLASIGLGFVCEPALARFIRPTFAALPDSLQFLATHGVASALAFAFITFLHVVFGELIPKTVALQVPDRAALWLARPLNWFTTLSGPVIWAMNGVGNGILRLCGYQPASGAEMLHSPEELLLVIEDIEEAGLLDAEQADLIENVFHLSNKRVRDCMVPRERMATLELSAQPDAVLEAVRNGAHTRMPVYEGDLDRIVGIVNTKDLFYLWSLQGVVVLHDALYPALFLPPDESVANALRLFRKAKRPMALVRAEDERILGLITLEDVIEEIVGELEDEHDRPTPKLKLVRRRAGASGLHPLLRPGRDSAASTQRPLPPS